MEIAEILKINRGVIARKCEKETTTDTRIKTWKIIITGTIFIFELF